MKIVNLPSGFVLFLALIVWKFAHSVPRWLLIAAGVALFVLVARVIFVIAWFFISNPLMTVKLVLGCAIIGGLLYLIFLAAVLTGGFGRAAREANESAKIPNLLVQTKPVESAILSSDPKKEVYADVFKEGGCLFVIVSSGKRPVQETIVFGSQAGVSIDSLWSALKERRTPDSKEWYEAQSVETEDWKRRRPELTTENLDVKIWHVDDASRSVVMFVCANKDRGWSWIETFLPALTNSEDYQTNIRPKINDIITKYKDYINSAKSTSATPEIRKAKRIHSTPITDSDRR
jgi:hypothetical protein